MNAGAVLSTPQRGTKNGEPREVPLTENLKVLLGAVIAGRSPNEPLFPVKEMRHAWKRLCKRAGLKSGKREGYIIHDTRRTAARTKRAAGVSDTVTCKIMVWKPESKMFHRYGIVDRADMAEALKRSEKYEADFAELGTFGRVLAESAQIHPKPAPEAAEATRPN